MRLVPLSALLMVSTGAVLLASPPPQSPGAKPGISSPQPALLIHNADLVLKVPDYEAAEITVLRLAHEHQAELRAAETQVNFQGKKHGWLLLQADVLQLNPLTSGVRSVGKLYSEQIGTNDQTSYYQKLERRIALLNRNEQELLEFLRRPRRMRGSDILFIQSRLFQTRAEAADAAQNRADLERASQHCLLRVTLFEPQPRRAFDWGNWHAHAAYRAKTAFLSVARKLVTAAYLVVWFAPLWIPIGLVLCLIWRRLSRRARAQASGSPGIGSAT